MKHVRLKSDPQTIPIRLAALEARITVLLIRLSDARRERDALKAEVERVQSVCDDDAWKQD